MPRDFHAEWASADTLDAAQTPVTPPMDVATRELARLESPRRRRNRRAVPQWLSLCFVVGAFGGWLLTLLKLYASLSSSAMKLIGSLIG